MDRPFPGFSQLFRLHDPRGTRAYRGQAPVGGDYVRLLRAEYEPPVPITINWMMGGSTPGDAIQTGHVSVVAISQRVVDLLEAEGFTGWGTYPVEVFEKTGEKVPDYYGLSIAGRCGPVMDSMSKVVPTQFLAQVSPVLKGLYFDPSTWDGSDLFMPSGKNALKLVTQGVKAARERAMVRNVRFTSLDNVESDMLTVEPELPASN